MRKSYVASFVVMVGAGIAVGVLVGGRPARAAGAQTLVPLISSVTPGWECVPTTAGQAVLSGGTGAAPSCGAGTTAVLAPTYVASGVGGKPTVEFNAVNVQIVSGSGSTSGTVNGEGNLVVGYAENANGYSQTGSNNLIVGSNNGWKSYGGIVGGYSNQDLSKYSSLFGGSNSASGEYNLMGGYHNKATAPYASVTGGRDNLASGNSSSVAGGCLNVAGTGTPPSGTCSADNQSVLGGFENTASGVEATISGGEVGVASGGASSVSGGQFNGASGGGSSVSGGDENTASGSFASISGGFSNSATTFDASVSGGESNTAQASGASVLGGDSNTASSSCQAIPAAPGTC